MGNTHRCSSYEACFYASFLREADYVAQTIDPEPCLLIINGQEQPLNSFLQGFVTETAERLGYTKTSIPECDRRCGSCVLMNTELELHIRQT